MREDCPEYQTLLQLYKSSQHQWAIYAYEANRHLRSTSERKSAQIRKEEKARMAELSAQMSIHTNKCPVCLVPKEG
jgi:hypothetical protein